MPSDEQPGSLQSKTPPDLGGSSGSSSPEPSGGPPSCIGAPSAHHAALFLLHYLNYLFACLPPPLEHKLLKSLQLYSLALLCFPSPQNSLCTCYIHQYQEDLLTTAVQTNAVDSRRAEMDGEA